MAGMTVEVGTDRIPYLGNLLPLVDEMGAVSDQCPADIREYIVAIRQRTSVFCNLDLTLCMVLCCPGLSASLRTFYAHSPEYVKLPLEHLVHNTRFIAFGSEGHVMKMDGGLLNGNYSFHLLERIPSTY